MPKSRESKLRVESATFTVDSQIFRELGELLVGHDATALLELVKNSYDADATVVTVHGDNLDSTRQGSIVVTDDGTGMSLARFRAGYLRLAGRQKAAGDRRSRRFHRRFTGEKGVGRLAAHKLARVLEIDSVPWSEAMSRPRGVRARIDWSRVERRATLEKAGEALELASYLPAPTRTHGTSITLSRLRHTWSDEEIARFVADAQAFFPPEPLIYSPALRKLLRPKKLLFDRPKVRASAPDEDPGFKVELLGAFALASEYWDDLVNTVEWVIEIDAQADGVSYCLAPTRREREYTGGYARRETFRIDHPDPDSGPFFQARLLVRSRAGSRLFRAWSETVAGVRVYSEGFRVLPYGEPENDWLELNRAYVTRSRALGLIDENRKLASAVDLGDDDAVGLRVLPSDTYLGAIFLTRENSGELQMLVNREGFVPNRAFSNLRDLTRLGTGLLVRARAAARQAKREADQAVEADSDKPDAEEDEPSTGLDLQAEVAEALEAASANLATLRDSPASSGFSSAELERLSTSMDRLSTTVSAMVSEYRLLPVLASVGIQMGDFVHEINGLLAMSAAADDLIGGLREDPESFQTKEARRVAAEAHQTVRDLRGRLERQSSYLIDLTGPTAVRRRSRQRLAERFDRAAGLIKPAVERRQIQIWNRIPAEIRTPPMFPAELMAVLLNLLTNAVKAAGDGGRISASGRQLKDRAQLRIQNTGATVDLNEAERWFRPFETTTTELDPILGQGMGFGLPIARGILEEYGATIAFRKPRRPYATAVVVEFPE